MDEKDIEQSFVGQRVDYTGKAIDEELVSQGPFPIFEAWYKQALSIGLIEANAMSLATVSTASRVSSRTVLLKGYSEEGFCFYTNYNSRKGMDLVVNPSAALLFYWGKHQRQVRIEGVVKKLTAEDSDKYFASRPRSAQISAVVSNQSAEIESRASLLSKREQLEVKLKDQPVKRPEHWGGYRLVPDYFEFWQGQNSRLHDRVAFVLQDTSWQVKRLAP